MVQIGILHGQEEYIKIMVTNIPKNIATPTNQERSSKDLTWNEADFPWDEATGTWNNPYAINNQAKNTASPTNQAKS